MTTIMQRNAAENERGATNKSWLSRHKLLVVVIVAAAVGTGLAIGLTRGGSSSGTTSSGTPTITITPGVPTITGSH